MSEHFDLVTQALLTLTEPGPDMDREQARRLLVDAWNVGYEAGRNDPAQLGELGAPNPFLVRPLAGPGVDPAEWKVSLRSAVGSEGTTK